ncbi:CRISPR-associated protein Cst1 [Kitasatospora sp. SolWspMP-SS2h]|nr:CRISPR-associated protein Cst1 [Kitasatospora sp. SolWspMP-SS2h]
MSVLAASGHPLQRAGAWAVAVLAGCPTPEAVGPDGLDAVVAGLVADVVAAATASKDASRYDWWKVLFALYPNSKATHSKRPSDARVLRPAIEEMFAPDAPGAGAVWPCTFCGAASAVVWSKANLPLFDTAKALNNLPPRLAGWPVCRGCRVAMWALPYGAWVTAGSASVLSCESPDAEREFARRNVGRARKLMQTGFNALQAGAKPEQVVLAALRDAGGGLCASTLWSFKNDNQEPWLRVTRTRRAVPVFLERVDGNAPLRRGWRLLCRSLDRYNPDTGRITGGRGAAARLVFEAEDGRSRPLLGQVHRLLSDTDAALPPGDRRALGALATAYAKEVFGMDVDVEPVARVLAEWIARGTSPRGRLAEYRSAALNDYRLGMLLVQAHFRLQLDGAQVQAAGPEAWKPLIGRRSRAWELRMLLFARVCELLQERGVAVGADPASKDEAEDEVEDGPVSARPGLSVPARLDPAALPCPALPRPGRVRPRPVRRSVARTASCSDPGGPVRVSVHRVAGGCVTDCL